jgi:hypothetical protein
MDASLAWLIHAQDLTRTGGVAGFYSLLNGWHDAYPETTGYIIQTFIDHYKECRDESFLTRALAMADWEIAIQLPNGGVRAFCLKRGLSNRPLVFDTGQVLLGWTSLYRYTKEPKYLAASLRAAHWLLENQETNGTWTNYIYRQHCGAYHSRVAWAMLQVANDSERDDLRDGAVAFLQQVLSQQGTSGFFPNTGFKPRSHYFTHAIAYTLEGLIGASQELSNAQLSKRLMGSVLLTCEPLLAQYTRTKTLYGEYQPDFRPTTTHYQCATGTAQLAWCFLKVFEYSHDQRYLHTALAMIDDVKSMQVLRTGNSSLDGSIPGSYPLWGRYQRWRLVTWAAKFLCDALLVKNAATSTSPHTKPNETLPRKKIE